jgi:hypothetical protein
MQWLKRESRVVDFMREIVFAIRTVEVLASLIIVVAAAVAAVKWLRRPS